MKFWEELDAQENPFSAKNLIHTEITSAKHDIAACVDLYNQAKSHTPSAVKCVMPGEVYQIYGATRHSEYLRLDTTDGKKYKGTFMEHSFYDEILLSKKMFQDHFPNFYYNALLELADN